jgi:crotonobetainyl-CoA:carnitine CoA-transferase CaiB-like acyl-CoA transferase
MVTLWTLSFGMECTLLTGMGSLDGIVVADFSRVLAGPYCTMLLADLGADVIKVESPRGDDTRQWLPPTDADGVGTYYLAVNRNKRSIALDLADPTDSDAARELARRADVLVHNLRPGAMERFGLGYDDVATTNPKVVYCSISGFGPDSSLPGYDLLVQAASGMMSLTGAPDGPPYRAGVAVIDVMTGLHAATGILAALHHRDVTGQGQHVQTNLLSAALSSLVNQTSAYVAGGVVPHRMGNEHLSLYPYEPMATGDGELIIAVGNDQQFRRLAAAVGAPELADDAKFATMAGRNANRQELRTLLLDRLAEKPAQEWFRILADADIPCGPINDVRQGVELATELGLDPVARAGGVPTIRNPLTLSATPTRHELAPPKLDEHGAEIRAWLDRS